MGGEGGVPPSANRMMQNWSDRLVRSRDGAEVLNRLSARPAADVGRQPRHRRGRDIIFSVKRSSGLPSVG